MAHTLHHIHLRAQDPRKSAQWYVDVFEAKAAPERDIRGALSCPVVLGGVTISISGPRDAEKLAASSTDVRMGLDHIAVGTDDLARDLAKMKQKGTKILEEILLPTGGKVAFIAGPDNVRIEVMQV